MKAILYTLTCLLAISFIANAQPKPKDTRWKRIFLSHMYAQQNLKISSQRAALKINPYWENIDAPHFRNNFSPQVKVPTWNAVWTHIGFDSLGNDTRWFLRTANAGRTWRLDTIANPGYVIGSISPVDGETCYASMYRQSFDGSATTGGGIFKTTNGGLSWKQLGLGKIFDVNSFPDFVNFFDKQRGVAVGDGHGADSTYLEIYTTNDAGETWQRVAKQNLPPTIGRAFSFPFQSYAVAGNTIWFRAYDDQSNYYLYRSDDFGRSWQQYPSSPEYFDFAFSDKRRGLATGFDQNGAFYLAATQDGGKTYNKIKYTGTPKLLLAAIPHTHVFVSTWFGSSYSTDYGITWHTIDSDESATHADLEFLNPFVGWTGQGFDPEPSGGMYKWKLHFSLDNDVTNATKEENRRFLAEKEFITTPNATLYPNPAKDVVTIAGLNTAAKTTLSLFTVSGRFVQQITVNARGVFNIQNLPAGSYYIQVQSANQNATLKFVKE